MTETPPASESETPLPPARADRPVTLGHRVEYALLRLSFAVFKIIGVGAASGLSGGFLRRIGPLIRPVSRRAEENLRAAFPDWSERQVRQTVAGVWENLGRTAAEFTHLDAFQSSAPGRRVEIIGRDKVDAYLASGRPQIFVSGHFANWEVLPIQLRQAGIDAALVYRAANNPLVDGLIIRRRAEVMSRTQIPKGKRGGRALVDALQSGKSLAMLVDQKLNDGIPAPFLGREAMTAPAAARLSLKFGAPIVPASIERVNGAHMRIAIHDPIDFTPTGDVTDDVRTLTIRINEFLEREIIARPEQWLWLHRRWAKPGAR